MRTIKETSDALEMQPIRTVMPARSAEGQISMVTVIVIMVALRLQKLPSV